MAINNPGTITATVKVDSSELDQAIEKYKTLAFEVRLAALDRAIEMGGLNIIERAREFERYLRGE
jgi:hypothetical protein